jgi:hypothetical protein
MATESLTYAQIAERLGINAEAARGLVRRHHLPRSTANDGKTVILVDLDEIQHRKSARKPGGVQEDSGRTRLEELLARVTELEAELTAANERAGGFRADYERERDRGDRLMATHDSLVTELGALRKAMEVQADATRSPTGGHLDAARNPGGGRPDTADSMLKADVDRLTAELASERAAQQVDRELQTAQLAQRDAELAAARAAADKATAELVELARRLAQIAEKQNAEPEPPRRSAAGRAWRWFLRN